MAIHTLDGASTGSVCGEVTDSSPRDSFSISAPKCCRAFIADGVGSRKLCVKIKKKHKKKLVKVYVLGW